MICTHRCVEEVDVSAVNLNGVCGGVVGPSCMDCTYHVSDYIQHYSNRLVRTSFTLVFGSPMRS
jgi:hypothetical protein